MTRRDVTGAGAGQGLSGRGVVRMVVAEFLAAHFPEGEVTVRTADGEAITERWANAPHPVPHKHRDTT